MTARTGDLAHLNDTDRPRAYTRKQTLLPTATLAAAPDGGVRWMLPFGDAGSAGRGLHAHLGAARPFPASGGSCSGGDAIPPPSSLTCSVAQNPNIVLPLARFMDGTG